MGNNREKKIEKKRRKRDEEIKTREERKHLPRRIKTNERKKKDEKGLQGKNA